MMCDIWERNSHNKIKAQVFPCIATHSSRSYPQVITYFLQWNVRALPYHFLCPARAFLPFYELHEMQKKILTSQLGTASTGWPQVQQWQALGCYWPRAPCSNLVLRTWLSSKKPSASVCHYPVSGSHSWRFIPHPFAQTACKLKYPCWKSHRSVTSARKPSVLHPFQLKM